MRFSDAETLFTPQPGEMRCLEIDDLVAMVEGTLPRERIELVLGHVDRCAVCAEIIANLGSLEGPERRVGRYQIERLLGTGGMGIVYAAFDPELQRRVAIKLVRPDSTNEALQALMVKEARTLAQLSHPNVVAVHDVGEHDGEVYFATELVDGVTLAEWQIGRSTSELVGAWTQVARGLAAAHAAGVVHRDVKPSNVLVARDGRARIGDFGIAYRATPAADGAVEALESQPAMTTVIARTPAYMAPEQKSGRVDARSDQFSTAVAIVEALQGKRPSAGQTIALDPPALAAVLTRALATDPSARFANMTDFADALVRTTAAPAPRSRTRLVAIGAAVAVVAAGAIAIVALKRAADGGGCRVDEAPVAVWSPYRREALAKVLPVDMGPFVDRWIAKWTTTAADVCVSTHEPALQAARKRCLARMMTKLDDLLGGWERKPPTRALYLHAGLEGLPHAAWCSHASVATAGEPTAEQAATVTEIERELDAVDGRAASSIAIVEKLRERARATGHGPLVRRAARALASLQLPSPPAQIQTLRAATSDGPDDFSKVVATLDLMSVLGANAHAEADALAAKARARIAALGGDPALEAELDFRLGQVLATTERHADAIAAFERAHHGMRSAYGDEAPQVANALVGLAGSYYRRDGATSTQAREAAMAADVIWKRTGLDMPSVLIPTTIAEQIAKLQRLETIALEIYGANSQAVFDAEYALMDAHVIAEQPGEALAHAQRADALGKRLGLQTARIPYVRSSIASILNDLGRPSEAIPFARDAIAVAEVLKLDQEVSTARSILGRALIESGRPAEARAPLEAALRWLSSTNQPARFRGRARFLLATVTNRAEDARIARAEIESFLTTPDADPAVSPIGAPSLRRDTEQWLRKVDTWLTGHRK